MTKNIFLIKIGGIGAIVDWELVYNKKTGGVELVTKKNPDAPKACDAMAVAVGSGAGVQAPKVVSKDEDLAPVENDVLKVDEAEELEILRVQEEERALADNTLQVGPASVDNVDDVNQI